MPQLVAIALSGGIDSLVTAALLEERGYQLIGLHFLSGFEPDFQLPSLQGPPDETLAAVKDRAHERLTAMTAPLGMPIHVIDLRREFQQTVVDYFTAVYQSGKTPNPCLVCNPLIKFDILFKKAEALGAVRMATGHYARIESGSDGHMHLLRGIDPVKEQSYFLSRLTQSQLGRAILPLGAYTKEQTRQMAAKRGLQPACRQESQDICFISNGSYGDFLLSQPGFTCAAGVVEDASGRQIGRHNGLHHFTIGQRRGINCPAAEPYYVIRIDPGRNTLIVGSKNELLKGQCRAETINWIVPPPVGAIRVDVRVRYRHAAVPATLVPVDDRTAEIVFDEPQSAVTPGQGAVFYRHEEVLGGGWIQ